MPANDNLANGKSDREKSGVEKLPESIRKNIFVVTMVIIMLIIISFWLALLKNTFGSLGQNGKNEELQQITSDLNTLLIESKKNLDEIKNKITEPVTIATSSTTTIELSPEVLDELKQKILEKEKN